MRRNSDTLVVVPAWNEERNLPFVLDEIRSSGSWDVIVVDDASRDATARMANQSGVQLLQLPINLGIGGAVQTGYRFGLQAGYEYVVQVDSDGQHVASDIEKLLKPLREGYADLVVGSRFLEGEGKYSTTWTRRLGIYFFSKAALTVGSLAIRDVTSGFRAINRRALSHWAKTYPSDFPDAPALLQLHLEGLRLLEMPAGFRERRSGSSSTTILRSIYYPFKGLLSMMVVLLGKLQSDFSKDEFRP